MVTLFLALISLVVASDAYALPSFEEVKEGYKASDAFLLDRDGKVVHELRLDPRGRRLEWASLRDISPALVRAVIHSEDRRFHDHSGVDWLAAGAAVIGNLFTKSQRGASTITMQLVAALDKDLRPRRSKRTLEQKRDQMSAARDIERSWTKDQVFEAYLNLVTFRGELQGVPAASRGLFGKEPNGLGDAESLLLASLIRSPNASAEEVSRRACSLAASMKSAAGCGEIGELARKTLTKSYTVKQRTILAPHVARALLKHGSSSAVSTLDRDLQRFAIDALRRHIDVVRSQNVNDGAVLVLDNKTGDVLAYVGNAGDGSSARHVDGVLAKRQGGSTLKPFLYALAFDKRILTPASVLNDDPLDVATPLGIYQPENYENDFKGPVSVRTALASSLNVPAVRVVGLIGVGSFVQKLRELGFSDLEDDDYYGPSIALGSADVNLYELVNAYRTLANRGVWSEARMSFRKTAGQNRRVFSERAAFLVSSILSDREARSVTFGLENPLSTRFWTAVKTGTSKDMRDNWCIGYSGNYTVGVWVGNFSGRPMWNVSGITGAAPVWLEIMNRLHNKAGSDRPLKVPDSVIAKRIDFRDGIEPPRIEVFDAGTEPETIALKDRHENPRIIYPQNGTIIALDPDIPEENEAVFFEARFSGGRFRWVLNNEEMGGARDMVRWRPRHGRYVLAIKDEYDNVIDAVNFEVRGTKIH